MGIYVPLWDQLGVDDLDITDHNFRSPDDVLEWGRRDSLVTWKTWPEVWHLDHDGVFHCYFKASSGDGIREWCDDPIDLHISRFAGQEAEDGCAPNWLIIESRQDYLYDPAAPTEQDAWAFGAVRREMAAIGVNVVDCVIFDSTSQWWSMWGLEHPNEPYRLVGDFGEA
jgi:hypothetical protein